jgi:hypothetical protein
VAGSSPCEGGLAFKQSTETGKLSCRPLIQSDPLSERFRRQCEPVPIGQHALSSDDEVVLRKLSESPPCGVHGAVNKPARLRRSPEFDPIAANT